MRNIYINAPKLILKKKKIQKFTELVFPHSSFSISKKK